VSEPALMVRRGVARPWHRVDVIAHIRAVNALAYRHHHYYHHTTSGTGHGGGVLGVIIGVVVLVLVLGGLLIGKLARKRDL
jgi:hypothetical protein